MNRTELADRIAIEHGLSRREAKRWIDGVLTAISQTLGSGGKVSLSGFGTFEVHHHREKLGRNPHTGERLLLPPRKAVVFRPSPLLRDSLGESGSDGQDICQGCQKRGNAADAESDPRQPDAAVSSQRQPHE